MAKQKHLTLEERFHISNPLDSNNSFKAIGRELGKDGTTISKEIKNHVIFQKSGAFGRSYNACIHRLTCDNRLVCSACSSSRKYHFCRFCKNCNRQCPDFEQEFCARHSKPPYTCYTEVFIRVCYPYRPSPENFGIVLDALQPVQFFHHIFIFPAFVFRGRIHFFKRFSQVFERCKSIESGSSGYTFMPKLPSLFCYPKSI